MKRTKQEAGEILRQLSRLEASWQDAHSSRIVGYVKTLEKDAAVIRATIENLLKKDFDAASDIVRLLLDLSADEFKAARRQEFGKEGRLGAGKMRYLKSPNEYLDALDRLGLSDAIAQVVERKPHWSDILVERLKGGRGSAIKGQQRGRELEIEVEAVVRSVFGPEGYCMRCRFVGRDGISTEKADVAVPASADPRILIEVKGYGATGSKQTDVIGDVKRICAEKRSDTTFLLVVDGLTWLDRANDLRKLVAMQNEGEISRIYTTRMFPLMKEELEGLRGEHHLPEHAEGGG
jgi:hypothetical protein